MAHGVPSRHPSPVRLAGRIALGLLLLVAGVAHLTFGRAAFAAQVPSFLPVSADAVVVWSGIVELVLGAAVIALPRHRVLVGWLVAAFFVAVFPGNVAQFVGRVDAFGLTSDTARGVRLLFQPLLVVWALWATGAWRDRRRRIS
ncbi:MAG: hypothetical protein RL338_1083 [Chloroflexota bacterium]